MRKGFVIWFTGLSGSGKSTLAAMIAAELRSRGVHVETLDGDDVRRHLSKGLGFSREDRDENVRRIGFVAKLVARSGACAIAAVISPYSSVREEMRSSIERFVEVYTECPIAVLADRDPKGLYRKALAGEIRHFTGVDDPYEPPIAPEVHLDTSRETPEESLGKLLRKLERDGLVPTREGTGARHDGAALPAPHGGELVERACPPGGGAWRNLPELELGPLDHANLVMIATGALSPLRGFMTSKDYLRVAREMRLENGLPWGLPVTLTVPEQRAAGLAKAGIVALRAPGGRVVARLEVTDIFRPHELVARSGDDDLGHAVAPGVVAIGGEIQCLDPTPPPQLGPYLSPRLVRGELAARGLRDVVAAVGASPPLRGEEYLTRAALEFADAVLAQPTACPRDALPVAVRARCYVALLERYFPPCRSLVAPVAEAPARLEARTVVQRAVVARNFGASRLLTLDGPAREGREPRPMVRSLLQEIGVEWLRAGVPALSTAAGMGTSHSLVRDPLPIDVHEALAAVRRGEAHPAVRPEVAAVLVDHWNDAVTERRLELKEEPARVMV